MHHDLKLYDEFFQDVVDCRRKVDIRYNDRNYAVGDSITFKEGSHVDGEFKFSGRCVSCLISHIATDYGLQDGYVCLSLSKVGMMIV